jgi:hypothetical protein
VGKRSNQGLCILIQEKLFDSIVMVCIISSGYSYSNSIVNFPEVLQKCKQIFNQANFEETEGACDPYRGGAQ